jgi:hypothetical protein
LNLKNDCWVPLDGIITKKSTDAWAGRTVIHKIVYEIIEKQTLRKYKRSVGIFGDFLIFFWWQIENASFLFWRGNI